MTHALFQLEFDDELRVRARDTPPPCSEVLDVTPNFVLRVLAPPVTFCSITFEVRHHQAQHVGK
jgi:hypothetical protein